MPNTLTDLIPDAYAALDVVSRELTGVIPGVTRNASADRVALNQPLRSHVVPANTAEDYVPAMSVPPRKDQAIGNVPLLLTKNRSASFSWTGEEEYAVDQGPGCLTIQQAQIAQSFRVLVNEMENDLATAIALASSRAHGTAGTTPFGSNLGDTAQVKKILDDNGAPASERSLVIDTSAGANMRTLSNLTKANEAGSSMTLRDGELGNVHGFSIRESAQISNAAAGTGASYLINGALSQGDTVITVDGGTGTIIPGDIVTIGNFKYVVAIVLAGGIFTIAAPGLQEDIADNAPATVNATSARNLAFCKSAVTLGTRLPIFPSQGDLAIDNEIITDPRTGINFDLRVYPGDGMVLYRIHAVWGWAVTKPEHSAILLG